MGRLLALLATVIALVTGLVTVLGLVSGAFPPLTNLLLQFAVITVGLAILIGIINLLSVHVRRIAGRQRGWVYSFTLVASALIVIGLWLVGADRENRLMLEAVQVSIESSLAALVLFALVYGAYRLMRQRVTWHAVVFTAALLIMLLGALPLAEAGLLTQVRAWLLAVPVSAGARGILLGIALATIVAGIRVLIGQERSYRE
ncbi:MAG: hypothetical protein SNJ59_15205 [Aggregatilineales bacterium]